MGDEGEERPLRTFSHMICPCCTHQAPCDGGLSPTIATHGPGSEPRTQVLTGPASDAHRSCLSLTCAVPDTGAHPSTPPNDDLASFTSATLVFHTLFD